jgi:hypothetical protein
MTHKQLVMIFLLFFCAESRAFPFFGRVCKDWWSFVEHVCYMYYGDEEASPQFNVFVHEVAKKMNYNKPIICKRFYFLRYNAAAFRNIIWVDEKWFFSFSLKEQEAIIAHEICHLINKDYIKLLSASMMWFVSLIAVRTYLNEKFKDSNGFHDSLAYWGCFGLSYFTLSLVFQQYQQYREAIADRDSITLCNSRDGLICFLREIGIAYDRSFKSVFNIDAKHPADLYEALIVWYFCLFATHPSAERRIRNIYG